MPTLTVSAASYGLQLLMDEVADLLQPITPAGAPQQATPGAPSEWAAVQETLYLVAIPGMYESIREGLATPLDECERDLDW